MKMQTRSAAAALALMGMLAIGQGALAEPDQSLPGSDSLGGAYFVCDAGKSAFQVEYLGRGNDRALVTTAAATRIILKRAPVANGRSFQGKGMTFWTDGKAVRLTGFKFPYTECVRKN